LRVRRLEPPRSLHFVTAKNFRVGDDNKFGFFAQKPASQRSELNRKLCFVTKSLLAPDFIESLPFALVVAENMNGVILPQPAVKLRKKFVSLRFGNWRLERALRQRTKCFERLYRQSEFVFWRAGLRC